MARLLLAQSPTIQQRINARPEKSWIERFQQIVVGTQFDAPYDTLNFIHSRDHNDWKLAKLWMLLNFRQDGVTVHLRHHDVEQHDIKIVTLSHAQSLADALR